MIKRIQAATHTRSQTELASLLEISQSSVAEAKRRQAIPADWYLKLFEKLGVNPDWLKKRQRPGIPAHRGRICPQRRGRAAHRSRLVGIASGAVGACPGVRHVRRQHENRLTSGSASTDRKDRPPQAIRPRRDHRSGNGQRISRPHSALRRLCRHRHSRKPSRKRRTVRGTASL